MIEATAQEFDIFREADVQFCSFLSGIYTTLFQLGQQLDYGLNIKEVT